MIRANNLRQLQSRLTAALDRKAGQLMNGSISPSQFMAEGLELLGHAHNQSAYWGSARANRIGDIGIAARVARDATEEQRSFLFGFVRDLAENRYGLRTQGGEGAKRRLARFGLYALRLNGSANFAFVQTMVASEPQIEMLWVLGIAEHCSDCLYESNQGWRLASTLRKVPGSAGTKCLVRCKCKLSTRDGRQSYILG
jgi:hypothetical protein